jgi:VanZ family protein
LHDRDANLVTFNMTTPSSPYAGRFALFMFCAFLAAAIYASLWPFSGWASPLRPLFAFLHGPLWTGLRKWDIVLNFAGYFPLGLFAMLALMERRRSLTSISTALLVVVVSLSLFSVSMETLQNFLRRRTPSMEDVFINTVGALAGAVSALVVAPWLTRQGGLPGLRNRLFMTGGRTDLALVLIGIWFFTQLAPRTTLFGSGDARPYRISTVRFGLTPEYFAFVETAVCALALIAIAMLLRSFSHERARITWVFLGIVAAALLVRSFGFALYWDLASAFSWATRSATLGIAIGMVFALLALRGSPRLARWIAPAALGSMILITNVTSPDPGLWLKPRAVRASELSSLSLVARNTTMLWPFAALLLVLWPRRNTVVVAKPANQ